MINYYWTTNVINDKEEKDSFEAYVANNQRLLTRLKEIIEERENSLTSKEFSLSSYQDLNWSHTQAHINGLKAAYADIKQLTIID